MRNIVLLSDGTGNSSSSPFKTNVWRLYQALDKNGQTIFYDNGVGTQDFKPLALIGSALGIGLARNVKDLYIELSRNYRYGDTIFLFGFSRGAFTVRLLADMIARIGIVIASNEEQRRELVEFAYSEYKRDVARRATRDRPWLIAGQILQIWDRLFTSSPSRVFADAHAVPSIYIGVWDTVDAYGMPIEELKVAIDRYIWPMTFANRRLPPQAARGFHLLSLDDERPSFRPVLWEAGPNIEQVWLSGVHADVGGGYPDDGLAYCSLILMMDDARARGLKIDPVQYRDYLAKADIHGEIHDSRAGIAGYYRYGPRDVTALCNDPMLRAPVPIILGATALKRIGHRQRAYAPISIEGYGSVAFSSYFRSVPTESLAKQAARVADMQLLRDAIVRKRIAYLAMVFFTLVLMALPLMEKFNFPGLPAQMTIQLESRSDVLLDFLRSVQTGWNKLIASYSGLIVGAADSGILPGWTSIWLRSFARNPIISTGLLALVLWLFFRRISMLDRVIANRAEFAWRRL